MFRDQGMRVSPFPVREIMALSESDERMHTRGHRAATRFEHIFDWWLARSSHITELDIEEHKKRTKNVCGWGAPWPRGYERRILSNTDYLVNFDPRVKLSPLKQIFKQILFPFLKYRYEIPSLCMFFRFQIPLCYLFIMLVSS